uniref:TatD related DNase n=1 Tax=Arcella intermedia TaxID=1963864 RepID=A0A6B2LDR2_9EUKA
MPNIIKNMGLSDFSDLAAEVDRTAAAHNARCEAFLSVASDTETRLPTLRLIQDHPNIYGSFAIHPLYAYEYTDQAEAEILQCVASPKAVALGEIGLDYHDFGPKYSYAQPPLQQRIFRAQMQHALRLQKPIIIHTREAEPDTMSLMKEFIPPDWPVHVHCFTDSKEFAMSLVREWRNLYIGFTGVVTFKNSKKICDVLKGVPLDRLLLETDGPFMSPEPYRGKVCHPGYVPFIVKKISEIHQTSVLDIYQHTRLNTTRIFGI